MTRQKLRRTLWRLYLLIASLLAISLAAKMFGATPLCCGSKFGDVYEYLRDMSLLIATGGVAYISNVFQKRHGFVASLHEEWRDIIKSKSGIFAFTHLENPTHEQWVKAFTTLSETIDNMRIVYRNVGETDELVGLYPFAPLHDMRRALQSLDPTKNGPSTPEQRRLVRDAILQAFYALRETFLEELDLEAPERPLLISWRRMKKKGATAYALNAQERQSRVKNRTPSPDPAIDELLARLLEKEESTPKAWRPLDPATRDATRTRSGPAA